MELDSNAIVGRVLMKGHENNTSAGGSGPAAQVQFEFDNNDFTHTQFVHILAAIGRRLKSITSIRTSSRSVLPIMDWSRWRILGLLWSIFSFLFVNGAFSLVLHKSLKKQIHSF